MMDKSLALECNFIQLILTIKHITTLITLLFISLLSSPSWSETVTMNDLAERGGLYYAKFTDVPFTSEVVGKKNGKFKNGKKEGLHEFYHDIIIL
tara:strand:- start:213 stop:497 length:285 start_codon:yes stop_codon:yes gene_type:complete